MKSFLIEIISVSALLYVYYTLFLRNRSFHFFNRIYLLAILGFSIIIPFLHIPVGLNLVPKIIGHSHTISGYVSANNLPVNTAFESTDPGPDHLSQWVWSIYLLVALILLLRIAFAFIRISRLLKTHAVEKRDEVLIIKTNEKDAPFTFHKWLFWNNNIDLNSSLSAQILRHEAVHIKQMHSIDMVFAEIVFAFFWINPFIYLIKRELRAVHEFLADSAITKTTDKASFAKLLLMQALDTQTKMVHNFFGCIIRRRINMIAQLPQEKCFRLQKSACLLLAVCTLLLFSFDTTQQTSAKQTIDNMQIGFTKNKIDKDRNSINKTKATPATLVIETVPGEKEVITEAGNPAKIDSSATNESPLLKQPLQQPDKISLLNYRDKAIAYEISMPEDNLIPAFVHTRAPEAQVLINAAATKRKDDQAIFYPASQYNELVLIFNHNKSEPLSNDWKLQVLMADENGHFIKEESLKAEWITGFQAVKIDLQDLRKGTYHLQIHSSDYKYSTSCKLAKDYD